MSRKNGLFCTGLFIFGVTFYLAYDTTQNHTVSSFIYSYLNDFQKYLYLMSFYVLPILYFTRVPYMRSEYKIRLSKKTTSFVIGLVIRNSILTAGYIFMVHFISALFFGFELDITMKLVYPIITLFLFVTSCNTLYHAIYIIFEREVLGILCVIAANIFYLAIMLALQFYVFPLTTIENTWMVIFQVYIVAIIIVGIHVVLLYLPRKECLK